MEQSDFTSLANQIAGALGPSWVASGVTEPSGFRHVMHATGYGVYLKPDGIRLLINSTWPRRRTGQVMMPSMRSQERHTCRGITVAHDSSPEHIAQQIVRRLLPGYVPIWQQHKAEADLYDAEHAMAGRLAVQVQALLPGSTIGQDDRDQTRSVHGNYAQGFRSVIVHGSGAISLDLRLRPADAMQVVELVNTFKEQT